MATNSFKNTEPPPPPILKRLMRGTIRLLKYPRKIALRYNSTNAAIGEMIRESGDKHLNIYRKRNSSLVNWCIWFPLAIGFGFSIGSIYSHFGDYINYFYQVKSPLHAQGIFSTIGHVFTRIKGAIKYIPLTPWDYRPVVVGYILAELGAWFLSQNPAFKKEEHIIEVFSHLGFVDSTGNPWQVTWTPDAILITSFNCDPEQLATNMRFWSTINFPPTSPIIFKSNMNRFIIGRKYELNSNMTFEYHGQPLDQMITNPKEQTGKDEPKKISSQINDEEDTVED